jgi:hypothetical protein
LKRLPAAEVYGLGMKELWDIDPAKHKPGRDPHAGLAAVGNNAYGGGRFLYHQANNQVALGFVVHSELPTRTCSRSRNSSASSSTRKSARYVSKGGKRVSYGARAITEGGWQSIPKLDLPRRRADRLLGRLRQRAAHQGQPHRDEIRHAGRRGVPPPRSRAAARAMSWASLRSRRSAGSRELKLVKQRRTGCGPSSAAR